MSCGPKRTTEEQFIFPCGSRDLVHPDFLSTLANLRNTLQSVSTCQNHPKKVVHAIPAKDDFVDGIVNDLRFDRADAIVMIGIPSHDQDNKALPQGQQSEYATAAMKKFADLFGGATALRSYKGIYKSDKGEYLWDDTILIQAFTSPDNLQGNVKDVVAFARMVRKNLNQEAVMVVFNNVMRFIKAER